eukprot:TRINITY_DN39794_c0_g1_i1.p1 TRINITY_DN39794_c0_g1~~TRINITY_DN39794_c0_g1_i1.p1  ORF type:complete len:724 (+),score=317.56 TRINITY_DN39794_c0_g1_i1:74-2245(+)
MSALERQDSNLASGAGGGGASPAAGEGAEAVSPTAAGPPAGGMEIRQIVELLNQHLGTTLSLVEFDALSGIALLQKLNDLFASLSPQHNVDIQHEVQMTGNIGTTLMRMVEFLFSILNYKIPPTLKKDFEHNFVNGEKTLIYPIMYWVLTHIPQAKKRVYLAKYLVPVDVPEDLRASDDGVREVYNQYKTLVEEFIQTHRNVEQMRKDVTDPQEIGSRIKKLEQERDTLNQRIITTKEKLKGIPQWETLLKACQGLRQEQDEQAKHAEHTEKQERHLASAERNLAAAEQTLRELKRDGATSIEEMIRKMYEDVRMNKMLLEEKLPKDIELKSRQLDTLSRVLSEPVDLGALNREIQSLETEIADLQKKKEEKMKDKNVQQLQLFRQQATLTSNRKAAFLEELQSTKEEITKVKQAIAMKDEDLGRFSNQKIPKGEDFNKYANSLRDKSSKYKMMKAELNELRSEFGVLQRTEEILKGKVDLGEYQGILTTKKDLDAVNQRKHDLDGQKSQSLEELSSVVQEFVANIRERRNKLAPQILDLRNTRQKAQVVEADYQQRKELYENEQARLQAETGLLEEEVNALQADCRLNESLYHRLHSQLTIAAVAFKRVQDEKDFLSSDGRRLNEHYKSWSEMFDKKTAELDTRSRDLQKEKRDIEVRADENLQQMEWFRNLRRLLECKVAYFKREASEKKARPDLGVHEMGGVMMGDAGGMANVLVLGGAQ